MPDNGHQPPRTRSDDTNGDPWERQATEGPEAWAAFEIYRDQDRGARSLRQVARTLSKSGSLINGWSATHGWVGRAGAYDRHLDGIRRRAAEDRAVKMGERQATQLEAAGRAMMAPIQALMQRVAEARDRGEAPFDGVSTTALVRLATTAGRHVPAIVEAERLVAGLSTENVAGAPATVEQMREEVERKSRGELEDYLLGVDDGRARLAEKLGVELELGGTPAPASEGAG